MKLVLTDDSGSSMSYNLDRVFETGKPEELLAWAALQVFPCDDCARFVLSGHLEESTNKQYCNRCWIREHTQNCDRCCDREEGCETHRHRTHDCPVCHGTTRMPKSEGNN